MPEPRRRQGMPEQRRPLRRRLDSCAHEGARHERAPGKRVGTAEPRRLLTHEDPSAGACGASVLHGGGARLANLAGAGLLGPMATCATHGDAPSVPSNVLEVQRDACASTQPPPRPPQEERVLPAADGRLPVTLRADPCHGVRRQGPRQGGQGPVGNGRHSGSEIKEHSAPIVRVVEDGAPRRRQALRPLGREASRLALHQPDDVRRTERSEGHRSIRTPVAQQTADKRQRVGHCRGGERTCLSHGQAERGGVLWRWGLRERHRGRCDGSSTAQEVQEPLESRSIAASGALLVRSVSQVVCGVLWEELVYGATLLREPSAAVSHAAELPAR